MNLATLTYWGYYQILNIGVCVSLSRSVAKMSKQTAKKAIHNQDFFLSMPDSSMKMIYDIYEMLFVKSLPEATYGEDILNEVMQYSNEKIFQLQI